MNRLTTLILAILLFEVNGFGGETELAKLDSAIAKRQETALNKEKHLRQLQNSLMAASGADRQLQMLEQLYEDYYTYRFDSTSYYVHRSIDLARQTGNNYYLHKATIHKVLLNARGGYYNEAESELLKIPVDELPDDLKHEYYLAQFWLYMYWGQYNSNKNEEQSLHVKMMKEGLDGAIEYCRDSTATYAYLLGERSHIFEMDAKQAIGYYQEVVSKAPRLSKLYASAAFAMSQCYKKNEDLDNYEHWLVEAATVDMLTPLKENFALQELAVFLFHKDKGNIERATNYIYCSMEDAQFVNDRLRIITISQNFPMILSAYTAKIKKQKDTILYGLMALATLTLLILVSLYYIKKQNNKLHLHQRELRIKHEEVKQKNSLLEKQGEQLSLLNSKLLDTNQKREGLAKIYIDLCAKYIDKLKKYQKLVKHKIKANQSSELLTMISSERISEEDAATFIPKFDKAFLDLYPSFVDELNRLLQPGSQIVIKQPNTLTTELRIYALIRLGVKESSEIADLLFYSPQTIYNYRSAVKNKAKNKDTFDDDLQKLCTVIQ